MGLFSAYTKPLGMSDPDTSPGGITDALGFTDMGAGAESARRAGQLAKKYGGKARAELTAGYNQSRDYFNTGYDQANSLLAPASTATGYSSELMNLMQGGGLDPLINERRRGLESALAAQGLTRSGAGVTEMAQLPIDLVMGIEQNLYGRKGGLADLSLGRGAGLADMTTNYHSNLASSYSGLGQDMISSELAAAQANAADRAALTSFSNVQQSNMNDAAENVMGMFGGMMGG